MIALPETSWISRSGGLSRVESGTPMTGYLRVETRETGSPKTFRIELWKTGCWHKPYFDDSDCLSSEAGSVIPVHHSGIK